MDALRRVVGAVLLLTAVIVGTYFVADQLEILPFLWPPLNYLMAVAAVLGVVFAFLRKRSLEAAGLDRIVTRRYLEANILFYGFIAIAMLFFWNWFDLLVDAEPARHRPPLSLDHRGHRRPPPLGRTRHAPSARRLRRINVPIIPAQAGIQRWNSEVGKY